MIQIEEETRALKCSVISISFDYKLIPHTIWYYFYMRYSTRSEAPTISADADTNHILCRTFHIFVSFGQAFYVSLKATMSHNELFTIIPSPFLVLCSVNTVTSQREPPG